jgi:hypothetical protein
VVRSVQVREQAAPEAGVGQARAQRPVGGGMCRRLATPAVRKTAVPATPLLAGALPRVDWSDAYVVRCTGAAPADPQVWADAVFRDPPVWVRALLAAREALVGLAGIDRAGTSAFDTVARTGDEVLLGIDQRHLDFRASVRREHGRVVVSTVVQIHNRRGRLYSAVVRRVHPVVVRAMLRRAARRLGVSRAR